MPVLNGYQLCEKVKGTAATQHIPLILLAGAFEPFDEDYMKSVGADDYILKPFESHELISKVKALLAHYEDSEPKKSDIQEVPLVAPAVETIPAGSNEWIESYHFPVADEPKSEAMDFEKQLKESIEILEEENELEHHEAMSIEEISQMVKQAVGVSTVAAQEKKPDQTVKALAPQVSAKIDDKSVEAVIRSSVQGLTESLKAGIEDTIRRQISELLPGIFEESIKKAVSEMSGNVQVMINAEIKKVVPDLAERIIRREIEKITSELA
jgi:CheY-like chemotaxis protein